MARSYWDINLEEMIGVGVHFGHGTRKWIPRMAPYISGKRKGIHITNLTRTACSLSETCDLVFDAASRGKHFLIVGTKDKAVDSVASATIRARCHYVNKKWLGDNRNQTIFSTIRNSEELRGGAIEQLEKARARLRKLEIEAENYKNESIHFEQQRARNKVRQRVFQQALQGALETLNSYLNNELHLRTISANIGMLGTMKI
ncbi:uncharacterized protein LOC110006769 [Amborella trichopoda]|uniref:uncharacterized protein LOC110006769 n=1 Tax=Amborella trichopoda TaxID=13333 RepID=UPI0009C172A1|nr:uncharacterized protein LOC110006769 [Amborella trichopoda]|eukprot:XP_020519506.1 uncharacterized protein LOC110006769 [Amborella trichopoda]